MAHHPAVHHNRPERAHHVGQHHVTGRHARGPGERHAGPGVVRRGLHREADLIARLQQLPADGVLTVSRLHVTGRRPPPLGTAEVVRVRAQLLSTGAALQKGDTADAALTAVAVVFDLVWTVEVGHGGGPGLEARLGPVHVVARLLSARPDDVHQLVGDSVVGRLIGCGAEAEEGSGHTTQQQETEEAS